MLQGVPAPVPPDIDPTVVIAGGGPSITETIAIVVISLSIAWVTYKLIAPLIRAWAARIEGKGNAELEQRVHELEQRLADGEQAQVRVADLEERLDFAERLLSQREEQGRMGPGGR